MSGIRKVEMLKRSQWFILAGLLIVGVLLLSAADGDAIFNIFWVYLLAVTGNFGLFAQANVKEHEHDTKKAD